MGDEMLWDPSVQQHLDKLVADHRSAPSSRADASRAQPFPLPLRVPTSRAPPSDHPKGAGPLPRRGTTGQRRGAKGSTPAKSRQIQAQRGRFGALVPPLSQDATQPEFSHGVPEGGMGAFAHGDVPPATGFPSDMEADSAEVGDDCGRNPGAKDRDEEVVVRGAEDTSDMDVRLSGRQPPSKRVVPISAAQVPLPRRTAPGHALSNQATPSGQPEQAGAFPSGDEEPSPWRSTRLRASLHVPAAPVQNGLSRFSAPGHVEQNRSSEPAPAVEPREVTNQAQTHAETTGVRRSGFSASAADLNGHDHPAERADHDNSTLKKERYSRDSTNANNTSTGDQSQDLRRLLAEKEVEVARLRAQLAGETGSRAAAKAADLHRQRIAESPDPAEGREPGEKETLPAFTELNLALSHIWSARRSSGSPVQQQDKLMTGDFHPTQSLRAVDWSSLSGCPIVRQLWTRCPHAMSFLIFEAEGERGRRHPAGKGGSVVSSPKGLAAVSAGSTATLTASGVRREGSDTAATQGKRVKACPRKSGQERLSCPELVDFPVLLLQVWNHQARVELLLGCLLKLVLWGLHGPQHASAPAQQLAEQALSLAQALVSISPRCCQVLRAQAASVDSAVRRLLGMAEDPPKASANAEAAGRGDHAPTSTTGRQAQGRVVFHLSSSAEVSANSSSSGVQLLRPNVEDVKFLEGGEDAWWSLLGAACDGTLSWTVREVSASMVCCAVADADAVGERGVFSHLLALGIVQKLLGKDQPAAVRLKGMDMAEMLSACPELLPLLVSPPLATSLPTGSKWLQGASSVCLDALAEKHHQPLLSSAGASAPSAPGEGSIAAHTPSVLTSLVICLTDSTLLVSLGALRTLGFLSSLQGSWLLSTCSASAQELASQRGRGDLSCDPVNHAVWACLNAVDKLLGLVYRRLSAGASNPGRELVERDDLRFIWGGLQSAAGILLRALQGDGESEGRGHVVVSRPDMGLGTRVLLWPQCQNNLNDLRGKAALAGTAVVQCGASLGLSPQSPLCAQASALTELLS